jgi:hypothetical protein
MNNSNRRTISLSSIFLAFVPLLTACGGGEEREYVVPEEICGARIDPELLEPLLPPGEEFRQSDDIAPMGCTISIDSGVDFIMFLHVTNSYTDPEEWASGSGITQTEPADIAGDAVLRNGENRAGATASFRCTVEEGNPVVPEGGKYALFDLDLPGSMNIEDEEERMQSIEDFARNYVEGLQEMVGCDS